MSYDFSNEVPSLVVIFHTLLRHHSFIHSFTCSLHKHKNKIIPSVCVNGTYGIGWIELLIHPLQTKQAND